MRNWIFYKKEYSTHIHKKSDMIIDGKKIAKQDYASIKKEIQELDISPKLCAFLVGNNSASLRYIEQKRKWAKKVGIEFILHHLPENTTESHLLEMIQTINEDTSIHGCMVQLPLPEQIDSHKVISTISPTKDVDGFHPLNIGKVVIWDTQGFVPCTPAGVMHLLESLSISLTGKQVVVIGRSNIVGKPLVNLMIQQWATVTSCNSHTGNIAYYTQNADIVVLAAGKPWLLGKDMLKSGSVVIDVGFTVVDGKIYGDARFEEIETSGHAVTPVPGWVWAMTVLHLMKNTLLAYKRQNEK